MGIERTVAVTLVLVTTIICVQSCNEEVCASLVSKCMLLKSCECDMSDKTNCSCCKDCHKCLAKLYTECCDCVGMCPEKNPKANWYKTSTVEVLPDPIPGLFSVLTEEPDPYLRWTTQSYPAHLDLLYFKPSGNSLNLDLSGDSDGTHITHGIHRIRIDPNIQYVNCSVAFMSPCMSLNKCRTSCQSMGAARYRWFHDFGCCECIGHTCLDYGKGEPQCLKCPLEEEEEDDLLDEPDPLEEAIQEEVVQQEEKIEEARRQLRDLQNDNLDDIVSLDDVDN